VQVSTQPSTRSPEVPASESPRKTPHAPSGRLLLRMPSELHGELARAAEREGTSLNQFIIRALTQVVGRQDAGESAPAHGKRAGRDLTVVVLAANAVAVGAAALAAIGILLVAWLG